MISLPASLAAWGEPLFAETLKQELMRQGGAGLPLQAGVSAGSHVVDRPISVIIKHCESTDVLIRAVVGIFFKSVIAGCSCADDPTPMNELDEFCELQLDIDKMTALTVVTLLD